MTIKAPHKRHKSSIIQEFIISNITDHSADIVNLVVEKFDISRQAASRHLKKLIEQGVVIAEGKTRSRQYLFRPIAIEKFKLQVTSDLKEDVVWRERVQPFLTDLSEDILDICHYGFTEIFNNVIDHSESLIVSVNIEYNPGLIEIRVSDVGVGIFNKIKAAFKLDDERHAALELSKGKVTTDPERHTGEGVFFASRMFDKFRIVSGHLLFYHEQKDGDWLLEDREINCEGTVVQMIIAPQSKRTSEEVFDQFTSVNSDDISTFSTTTVPVVLAMHGEEKLVSRSQAKRLLNRFNRFQKVVLDFKGVGSIGQAFADEVFRVFINDHPDIELVWINAGTKIEKMIQRVTAEIDRQEKLF